MVSHSCYSMLRTSFVVVVLSVLVLTCNSPLRPVSDSTSALSVVHSSQVASNPSPTNFLPASHTSTSTAPQLPGTTLSSSFLNGSLPSALTPLADPVSTPMYYNSTALLKPTFFTTHTLSSSLPVTTKVAFRPEPLSYGFSFADRNTSMVIDNKTLLGAGATGQATYDLGSTTNPTFIFDSYGSGGTVWTNYTLASFNGKQLINPFQANLSLSSSFKFLSINLPTDGIRYTFYLDVKFDVNSSVIADTFPAIFRFHLLYSPYYANYTLYPVPHHPELQYYLGGPSTINVLLNQAGVNQITSLDLNFSDVFTDIIQSLNDPAIIPYFCSFKSIELGFFSTNSSLSREAVLSFQHFQLFNSLEPKKWFSLSGSVSSAEGSIPLDSSLFTTPDVFPATTSLTFTLTPLQNSVFDFSLFGSTNYMLLDLTTSFFTDLSSSLTALNQDYLTWEAPYGSFPSLVFDASSFSAFFPSHLQSVYWFIDHSWIPQSLPTVFNHAVNLSSSSFLEQTALLSQSHQWFGGSLLTGSTFGPFMFQFLSPNLCSPVSVSSALIDNALHLDFSSTSSFQLSGQAAIFNSTTAPSSLLAQQSLGPTNTSSFSMIINFDSLPADVSHLLLVIDPGNPHVGFIVQFFSLTTITSSYDNTFSCNATGNSLFLASTFALNLSLNCSFKSGSFSQQFLDHLAVALTLLNQSSRFSFDTASTTSSVLSFSRVLYLPSRSLTTNSSFSVLFQLLYLSTSAPTVLWTNTSSFTVPVSTSVISPQTSDLYSSLPFYAFFSFVAYGLYVVHKNKTKSTIKKQIS